MSVDVVMPKIGESVVEGTVVRWLKQEGDPVSRDEPVLEIATDKIDTDIPSITGGVLKKILVQEGETVEVGQVLAVIDTGDTESAAAIAETETPQAILAPVSQETAADGIEPVLSTRTNEKQSHGRFYSPLVRSIAKQEGIAFEELDRLDGSGRNGRITKKDILGYLERRATASAAPGIQRTEDEALPATPSLVYGEDNADVTGMDSIRKVIAEHMVRSKRISPHVTSCSEVDMTHISRYRERVKEEFLRQEGYKLTFTPFFIAAIVDALRRYPSLNASVDGDKVVAWKHINMGVAVGLEKGIVVPVIRHAEEKNFLGIARTVQDLVFRARNRQLNPDELQGGTFTLTNPGMFDTLFGTPIINQPQVAIIATGAVKKRVVVMEGDTMAIRSMMYMSLSFDHRVVDGLIAARFTQDITENLEQFDLVEVGF